MTPSNELQNRLVQQGFLYSNAKAGSNVCGIEAAGKLKDHSG
jgi:hypothetical protein